MRSVKSLIAAGAATLMSTAAFAADMAIAPPPPAYAPAPIVEDFGGWYLRGDIGFSNQRVSHLDNALFKAFDPAETGSGIAGTDLLILAIWGAGGLLIALRRFKWSPQST